MAIALKDRDFTRYLCPSLPTAARGRPGHTRERQQARGPEPPRPPHPQGQAQGWGGGPGPGPGPSPSFAYLVTLVPTVRTLNGTIQPTKDCKSGRENAGWRLAPPPLFAKGFFPRTRGEGGTKPGPAGDGPTVETDERRLAQRLVRRAMQPSAPLPPHSYVALPNRILWRFFLFFRIPTFPRHPTQTRP